MVKLSLKKTSDEKLKFTLLLFCKGLQKNYSTRAKNLGDVVIAFTMVSAIVSSNLYQDDEK